MSRSATPLPRLDRRLPPHPLGRLRRGPGGRPRSAPAARSCRGGAARIDAATGYFVETSPDHPAARWGAVLQHRLVAECYLGRILKSSEVVHHKNRCRHDNRWSNLLVLSRRQHAALHAEEDRGVAPWLPERRVRAALRGRSTLDAARLLGVNHQTLRNRFGHLLTKRRSPGGPFDPAVVAKVRQLARDPKVGTIAACRILGMAQATLRACREKHRIPWTSAPTGRPTRPRPSAACATCSRGRIATGRARARMASCRARASASPGADR